MVKGDVYGSGTDVRISDADLYGLKADLYDSDTDVHFPGVLLHGVRSKNAVSTEVPQLQDRGIPMGSLSPLSMSSWPHRTGSPFSGTYSPPNHTHPPLNHTHPPIPSTFAQHHNFTAKQFVNHVHTCAILQRQVDELNQQLETDRATIRSLHKQKETELSEFSRREEAKLAELEQQKNDLLAVWTRTWP